MIEEIEYTLNVLREEKPLVLCLTNFVTQDFVANTILSLGAAPIMSACEEEIEELIQIASTLYINIGTIDKNFIRLTHKAVLLAKQYGKPIVFDPVGSGTTTIRTNAARDIMSSAQIIRGNASEIISLKSYIQSTKGVESSDTTDDAKNPAYLIASQYNATVIVSGKIDFITNGQRSVDVEFGSQTMQLITGMGCALTAVCAAFHSVISDAFDASALSTYYFTLCGEIVSQSHHMPGTFKSAFLDQIHHPNFKTMRGIYAL